MSRRNKGKSAVGKGLVVTNVGGKSSGVKIRNEAALESRMRKQEARHMESRADESAKVYQWMLDEGIFRYGLRLHPAGIPGKKLTKAEQILCCVLLLNTAFSAARFVFHDAPKEAARVNARADKLASQKSKADKLQASSSSKAPKTGDEYVTANATASRDTMLKSFDFASPQAVVTILQDAASRISANVSAIMSRPGLNETERQVELEKVAREANETMVFIESLDAASPVNASVVEQAKGYMVTLSKVGKIGTFVGDALRNFMTIPGAAGSDVPDATHPVYGDFAHDVDGDAAEDVRPLARQARSVEVASGVVLEDRQGPTIFLTAQLPCTVNVTDIVANLTGVVQNVVLKFQSSDGASIVGNSRVIVPQDGSIRMKVSIGSQNTTIPVSGVPDGVGLSVDGRNNTFVVGDEHFNAEVGGNKTVITNAGQDADSVNKISFEGVGKDATSQPVEMLGIYPAKEGELHAPYDYQSAAQIPGIAQSDGNIYQGAGGDVAVFVQLTGPSTQFGDDLNFPCIIKATFNDGILVGRQVLFDARNTSGISPNFQTSGVLTVPKDGPLLGDGSTLTISGFRTMPLPGDQVGIVFSYTRTDTQGSNTAVESAVDMVVVNTVSGNIVDAKTVGAAGVAETRLVDFVKGNVQMDLAAVGIEGDGDFVALPSRGGSPFDAGLNYNTVTDQIAPDLQTVSSGAPLESPTSPAIIFDDGASRAFYRDGEIVVSLLANETAVAQYKSVVVHEVFSGESYVLAPTVVNTVPKVVLIPEGVVGATVTVPSGSVVTINNQGQNTTFNFPSIAAGQNVTLEEYSINNETFTRIILNADTNRTVINFEGMDLAQVRAQIVDKLKVDTTITTIASSEPSTETSEAASTTKPSTTYSTVVITSTEEHGSGHNDTDNTTTTTTTTAKPPTKGNGNETKKDNGLADSTIAAISLAAAAAALALEEIFIGFIRKRLRRCNVVVPAANLPEAAQRPGPDEVVQIRQEEDEPPVVDEAVGVGGADLVEEAQLNPVIPEGNDDDIVPADEEREGEFGRVGRQHVPHLPRSVTGTELLPNRARLAPLPPTHLPPVRPVSVWTSVLNRVGSAFGSRETVADDGQWARPRDRSQSGITTSSSGDAMQMEDVGPNDHSEDQQVAGTRESRIGSPSSSATRRASSVVLEDGKSLKRSGKTDETGSRGST